VSDDEILAAMRLLARTEGVCAEPSAAATIAGLQRAAREGRVRASDTIVAVVTGSGLKDVNSAVRAAGAPHVIDADLGAFERLLSERIQL
jgi:threonine synthase